MNKESFFDQSCCKEQQLKVEWNGCYAGHYSCSPSDMHLTKEVRERSRQILIRLEFGRAHFEGPIDSIQSTAFQSRLAKAR